MRLNGARGLSYLTHILNMEKETKKEGRNSIVLFGYFGIQF